MVHRILIVGKKGVGKHSLIHRLGTGDLYDGTQEVNRTCKVSKRRVEFEVAESITKDQVYDAVIILVDLTNIESLYDVKQWEENIKPNTPCIVCGNKFDCDRSARLDPQAFNVFPLSVKSCYNIPSLSGGLARALNPRSVQLDHMWRRRSPRIHKPVSIECF
jgi:predicted GTPase